MIMCMYATISIPLAFRCRYGFPSVTGTTVGILKNPIAHRDHKQDNLFNKFQLPRTYNYGERAMYGKVSIYFYTGCCTLQNK